MTSVLHVLSSLQLGGAERFVIDLSRLQRRQGVEASILSLGSLEDTLVGEAHAQGIPLTICDREQPVHRMRHYRNVFRLFRQHDVIQIHSPYALRFLTPLILCFPHKRIIYTRHGLSPLTERNWRFLHRILRGFLHRVSFVTGSGREVFHRNYGWASDKLCVIENGAYIPEQIEIATRPVVRLGSVGRMVALKGQRFLLDSIGLLERELSGTDGPLPYELHFFGSGPLEPDLKRRAALLPAPVRVTFHGIEIDRERIYRGIDVLVVSSESEGLSLAIMEAMAYGICVIATDVGGNSRLVQPGISGTLVPYGNVRAMAEAIRDLVLHPERIAAYSRNARDFIKANYSLDETHKAYLACYSS